MPEKPKPETPVYWSDTPDRVLERLRQITGRREWWRYDGPRNGRPRSWWRCFRNGQVVCPGPGHSPRDRSLAVRFHADGGYVVHSFAGDDPMDCRDHVDRLLGLPRWKPWRAAAFAEAPGAAFFQCGDGSLSQNRARPQHL